MIWFLGDTHGHFEHIVPALRAAMRSNTQPAAVIFLGDLELAEPLEVIAKPIEDLGVRLWFIHGNHDVDRPVCFSNLFQSAYADRNLHGRIVEIDGLRVAGLGGVFSKDIWHLDIAGGEPLWLSYSDYAEHERNRFPALGSAVLEGRLRKHRGSIFFDDYEQLYGQCADILVTHEAPSCHPRGYLTVDELGRSMRIAKVFHGHHHDCLDYSHCTTRLGFQAHGVGFCGIADSAGRSIRGGKYDQARLERFRNLADDY